LKKETLGFNTPSHANPSAVFLSLPVYSTLILFLEQIDFKGKSQNQRAATADPR